MGGEPRLRLTSTVAWALAVTWGLAALTFHTVGNANGLYSQFWWFQIATHLWSASALAVLLAQAGWSLGLRGPRLIAFVVAFAAAGAVGWEVVEYLGVFPHLHFHGIDDSALDLAADAVAIGAVLVALAPWLRSDDDADERPSTADETTERPSTTDETEERPSAADKTDERPSTTDETDERPTSADDTTV